MTYFRYNCMWFIANCIKQTDYKYIFGQKNGSQMITDAYSRRYNVIFVIEISVYDQSEEKHAMLNYNRYRIDISQFIDDFAQLFVNFTQFKTFQCLPSRQTLDRSITCVIILVAFCNQQIQFDETIVQNQSPNHILSDNGPEEHTRQLQT